MAAPFNKLNQTESIKQSPVTDLTTLSQLACQIATGLVTNANLNLLAANEDTRQNIVQVSAALAIEIAQEVQDILNQP